MPAPYAGSTYPAVVAATETAAPSEPPALSTYAARVSPFVCESDLGVAYRSLAVHADGSISEALWYEHETGAWSPKFDASKHVKRLHRDPTFESLQCYAAPGALADDPSVVADVFTLKPDGTVIAPIATQPANEVSGIARGWFSKP